LRPDLWLPQGADEAHVSRALREYDDDLRLIPGVPKQGIPYKVYVYRGDQPAVFVCAWADKNGDPLPLSSALLEMVKLHDRHTRDRAPDADEMNARLRERQAHDNETDTEALVDDWRTREGRYALLPRSRSLYLARARARARGEQK